MTHTLSRPACETCGDTGLVDRAPGAGRRSEEDQRPCPDCATATPAHTAGPATAPAPAPGGRSCCCQWGAAIGRRYGVASQEWPEFPCGGCSTHGEPGDPAACRRHRRATS